MVKSFVRKDILRIEAYKPGKPIEEVQRELGIADVIKLASNENALGPSPLALKGIKTALASLHRYPEGTCYYLKKKLAKRLGVKPENLIFGNGSDELIDIICKTLKSPQAEIVTSETTFVEYKILGAVNGFIVRTAPLKNFRYDLNALRNTVTKKTKAVFIANPNNPTGTYCNNREVAEFLEAIPRDVLVVFDEAYIEYVQERDFPKLIPLINKRNIAVLRTFSKIYGLAGLRIGYMAADADFIACAERVRQPFNVNALAQAAALAALDDTDFVKTTREVVRREKTFITKALTQMGIWFQESATNFVFVRFDSDAGKIFKKLLGKGVIIREMSSYNLNRYARITIGTRAENIRLIKALTDVLQ